MVNPDPARFRFFVSICGPTPGSAAFSASSTSLAFALSSAALVLSSTSSSAPLPGAGPWPTSWPPPFFSSPPPDGPLTLGTVYPALRAPVPPLLISPPPLVASSPPPESSTLRLSSPPAPATPPVAFPPQIVGVEPQRALLLQMTLVKLRRSCRQEKETRAKRIRNFNSNSAQKFRIRLTGLV